MITLGVDLASADENTAACTIRWARGCAVAEVECGQDNESLLGLLNQADKAGVDVPFGWPDAFVDELTRYHGGGPWFAEDRAPLKFRATDLDVAARADKKPLSVSSQLIAVPAMRAARLFTRLAQLGIPVDRAGGGRLVEVYPAAALKIWQLPFTQYKDAKGAGLRRKIFTMLRARTSAWLNLDDAACATCIRSDDALDALVAALVARAAALGRCQKPPREHEERARREGWIALPPPDALDWLATP